MNSFLENGKLMLGINYWASENAINMWSDWKPEVIAKGEDGRPVFVKNKYGGGYIYFSTVGVEKYLTKRTDVFSDAKAPDYSVWYKALKQEIPDNRAIETDIAIACVTEHIIDKDSRYAIVINYSKNPVSTNLIVKENWEIDEVYYGNVKNNVASINQCDAVILKLKRVS